MTPKERVEAILLRQEADSVPFTVYECMIPQCEVERKLRNNGLCILHRISVFKRETPDVKATTTYYSENGISKVRTDIQTPYGNLFTISKIVDIDAPSKKTSWMEKRLFEKPEDYRPIIFMIKNRKYFPDYESVLKAQKLARGDIIFRAGVGYEPLQEIIVTIMGIETFSIEWSERRDEVLKLYDVIVEDRRKIYPIVAKSPLLHANYGGNVASEVVGVERFEKYILPHYQEFADIMHKEGKLAGTHLDGNNKNLAPLIRKSGLDYIEAFTPYDTDMSVKEAFEAWPDKILWINFPSSIHLQGPEKIKQTTLKILEEAKPGDKLIVGITEDVPESCWQESFTVILNTLNTFGKLPIK